MWNYLVPHQQKGQPVDWIVFGDDWGAHPSTTQHLIKNLPLEDRVLWVDSIGMRQPRLRVVDVRRLWGKALRILQGTPKELGGSSTKLAAQVKPKVIPWHLNPMGISFNIMSLSMTLERKFRELTMHEPLLLTSNPVVVNYLPAIPFSKCAYLRLDDYARLPGVDPLLVLRTDNAMIQRSDAVFATARGLMPHGGLSDKGHYLPQGVDWDNFAGMSLEPPKKKVLGFFGLVAEWMDFELIEAVARAAPDWTLEMVGPVQYRPASVTKVPNIRFLPPVPFKELPSSLSEWAAAWIPFEISELTAAVNPLKIREYLAAGLPSLCTPLPEVTNTTYDVAISNDPARVVEWLNETIATDTAELRGARRESVREDNWANRSEKMREVMKGLL